MICASLNNKTKELPAFSMFIKLARGFYRSAVWQERRSSRVTLSLLPHIFTCWQQTPQLLSICGTTAALTVPHRKSLGYPWWPWPRSHQISFPCHSFSWSSIRSVKEKFTRQQNRKTWKHFTKHQFLILRKSSLTQAWVMCLGMHSARVPLLYFPLSGLEGRLSHCMQFCPEGHLGLSVAWSVGFTLCSRSCFLVWKIKPLHVSHDECLARHCLGLCDSFIWKVHLWP